MNGMGEDSIGQRGVRESKKIDGCGVKCADSTVPILGPDSLEDSEVLFKGKNRVLATRHHWLNKPDWIVKG